MQVLASQLPFLANRIAELAVPPLFWTVNCIKIGGHVALLSGPTVYTLYCALAISGVASAISEGDIFTYSFSAQLISFEIESTSKEIIVENTNIYEYVPLTCRAGDATEWSYTVTDKTRQTKNNQRTRMVLKGV